VQRVYLISQVSVLWFWARRYRVKNFRVFVHDVLVILRSGLFLTEYYTGISSNRKPSRGFFQQTRLISHFLEIGAKEGFDPNPLFSVRFYLNSYPDVRESQINPLIHYIYHGSKEGRSTHTLFDGEFFERQMSDNLDPSDTPLGDFLKSGGSTGRDPCLLFDCKYYLSQKPGLTDYSNNPLIHYLEVGARSGFDPHRYFSSAFYEEHYSDEIPEGTTALEYFLYVGGHKGHQPSPKFDTPYYLEVNPDIGKSGVNPLVHYLEFGLLERRFPTDQYSDWVKLQTSNEPSTKECRQVIARLRYQPRFSIIVPVFNTDAIALRAMLDSVLDQVYPHWELCLANDGSTEPQVRTILDEYQGRCSSIKVYHSPMSRHISVASNAALAMATGEFIVLLDHDDLLDRLALFENACLLNDCPLAEIIYSDEDKINQRGLRYEPFMKPSWSPEFLLLEMYTGHLSVYKKDLIDKVGGFREGYEGSQDYDLMLRASELTQEIHHIPKVLYHWRTIEGSTAADPSAKEYAYVSGQKALQDALERRGLRAQVSRIPRASKMYSASRGSGDGNAGDEERSLSGTYDVSYLEDPALSVSVIVPSLENASRSKRLAAVLLLLLPYLKQPGVNVVLVIGGTQPFDLSDVEEPLSTGLFDTAYSMNFEEANLLIEKQVKIVRYKGTPRYSSLINAGVKSAEGKFLCFFDDSTSEVKHRVYGRGENWLGQMVAYADDKEIGGVGGLIVNHEQKVVISSGRVIDGDGNVADLHRSESIESAGYFARLLGSSNCTAVRLGCFVTGRKVFDEIGGLDQKLPDDLVDLEYGLCLREKGYRSVVLSQYHFFQNEPYFAENFDSAKSLSSDPERQRFLKKWGSQLPAQDPFYSPNLRFVGRSAKFHLDVDLPEDALTST
jgi:glycosyltransferase involved in cell wall biosynthesis